ncbi:MAG TPA: hypothetical protein VGY13_14935 [Solirubrobacteraceae bacterium]|nr:hypothetical protein [Solirubrobacteraceae bacterium]
MPSRPLVFVSGLAFGDYLLWNWSLAGNHATLALVSGLSLPPLALVCLGLIVLHLARMVFARSRGAAGPRAGGTRAHRARPGRRRASRRGTPLGEHTPSTTSAGRSSSKLAA